MYIRNAWYAAATSAELGDHLLARRVLDGPVVLFRDETGRASAIDERCPHRFAPLSQGRKCRSGTAIRCPYHGLEFDRTGACVGGLGGHVPPGVSVRAYPVEERHGLVWLWTGEPSLADPALIADLGFMDRGPQPARIRYIRLECDYRLATDNLMDLSHAAILHEETLGPLTPNLADGKLTARRDGKTVHASTRMLDVRLSPGAPPIDQWMEISWQVPGAMALQISKAEPGADKPPFVGHAMHVVTPETSTTTHYFTGSPFPRPNINLVRDPFLEEDGPMLAAVQRMMGGRDFWDMKPVILPGDTAAIHVRRLIDRLVREENAPVAEAAA